ncbi:preprotein translocase subunit SecY [Bacillus sp. FSL R12-0069]|uniref:preprotein translocase subunit SecY n=1 Tax=Bacillus sp. FSL R12-0069 TaxID=2975342 RepID=UPI0030F93A27
MLRAISKMLKMAEIRRKILFTLSLLLVFRLGTFIPVPFTNAKVLEEMLNIQDQTNILGMLNAFGGGALQKFSIFAVGITPYITASIIVQLLQMDVVPKFTEWAKQGEMGRKKLAQFTRYFTIILAFIQALGISIGLNHMTGKQLILTPVWNTYLLISIVFTAGTAFLIWLGEKITEKGIGNGVSILIFSGLVAEIPNMIKSIYLKELYMAGDQLFINIVKIVSIGLVMLAILLGAIYVQEAIRKIPIQYAKNGMRSTYYQGRAHTHLPLKVNSAGVIPVIFASAFLMLPQTIKTIAPDATLSKWLSTNLNFTHPIGMTLYVGLIIAFTYFYAFMQVNPEQMAENLKKQNAYIPSVRPGEETANYLTKILYRLTCVGAIFLGTISMLPMVVLQTVPEFAQMGGTSLLIIIGVALEIKKTIDSHIVRRYHKGFIQNI